ncbi:MAG: phage antirepressor KilAC domain-containing protein [Lachnospiraceae bacterium]|nr:phage antirepressor KilAC domain-containing protein [Lachnospiraceae bacterium]
MNDLQVFRNEEFGQIRTVEIDGEPYFVGKDIAQALGYKDTADVLKTRVDEEDKRLVKVGEIPTLETSNFGAYIINESGMYSLVLGSRLPSAKQFKRWITSEVIPSIRKNGGYIANQENLTPEQIVANALIVAQNIIASKDKQIEVMQPKADYFDALVERNLLTSFRDTAKEFGIGERYFINFLIEHRYIYRDQKKQLKPYSEKNKGLFEVKEYNARYSDHAGLQTLLTPKGRETFRLLILGEN